MSLSKNQVKQLKTIITLATSLLNQPNKSDTDVKKAPRKRTRRSGKELVSFRKMLKAERKTGTPVVELARRHGVSPAYIYQL